MVHGRLQDNAGPAPGEDAGRAEHEGTDAWSLHCPGPALKLHPGPGEATTCGGREEPWTGLS